jgi:aspartyl-tRNA(Asn)/glutamyl-tRNA(Gln) amidotransferase subunit C
MIEQSQVQHVAHLARLALTPEEETKLTDQLVNILSYVEQLQELDTTGVEPTFHVLEVPQPTRPDQVTPCPDGDAILYNAPDRSGQFFKVPRILNTEEG